ncbi:hypothetical protein [Microlunatus parietis]|uniref:Uncharacterized protein n=1 Tax=Microlunatus parietis TaxID=682979 RepID=A0A7Y9LEG7_9ACTN|nr:hypothetical protein [Microlunatus parietis]NYE73875.1 hypothetical protein [Microlunatus parietis]
MKDGSDSAADGGRLGGIGADPAADAGPGDAGPARALPGSGGSESSGRPPVETTIMTSSSARPSSAGPTLDFVARTIRETILAR